MSNQTQKTSKKQVLSINFEDVDHREILLFEISSSLNSLKEVPEKNEKSLKLINDMQRMLNELEGTLLPNS